MRAIFAIFLFFLFNAGNLTPGYSSQIDLQDNFKGYADLFFELQPQVSDDLVYTNGDPIGKGNKRSAESTVAEPNEEELSSSESSEQIKDDTTCQGQFLGSDLRHNQDTAVLNVFVRQSKNITPKLPNFLLFEVFRI